MAQKSLQNQDRTELEYDNRTRSALTAPVRVGVRAVTSQTRKKRKRARLQGAVAVAAVSSQSMQLEQPELDDEDSAAASPPKKKSRTATASGVSFHKTSGGRVSKSYQHRGDLYYNLNCTRVYVRINFYFPPFLFTYV